MSKRLVSLLYDFSQLLSSYFLHYQPLNGLRRCSQPYLHHILNRIFEWRQVSYGGHVCNLYAKHLQLPKVHLSMNECHHHEHHISFLNGGNALHVQAFCHLPEVVRTPGKGGRRDKMYSLDITSQFTSSVYSRYY